MAIYRVVNRESRLQTQERYIKYDLQKPLPDGWEEMTIDDQGAWLNENAEFIKDEFDDPYLQDMEEETIEIEKCE